MRYIERQKASFDWAVITAIIVNFSILALFIIGVRAVLGWLLGK